MSSIPMQTGRDASRTAHHYCHHGIAPDTCSVCLHGPDVADRSTVPADRAVTTLGPVWPYIVHDERDAGRDGPRMRTGASAFDHYGRAGRFHTRTSSDYETARNVIVPAGRRAGDDLAGAADAFFRAAFADGRIDDVELESLTRIGTDHRSWEQVVRIGHVDVLADVSRHSWQADMIDDRPEVPRDAITGEHRPDLASRRAVHPDSVGAALRDERARGRSIVRAGRRHVSWPTRYGIPSRRPRSGEVRTGPTLARRAYRRAGETRHRWPAIGTGRAMVAATGRGWVAATAVQSLPCYPRPGVVIVGHGPAMERPRTVRERRADERRAREVEAIASAYGPDRIASAAERVARAIAVGASRDLHGIDGTRVHVARGADGRVRWAVRDADGRTLANGRSMPGRAAAALSAALS